jgi:hypothetical protein
MCDKATGGGELLSCITLNDEKGLGIKLKGKYSVVYKALQEPPQSRQPQLH